MTDLTAQRRLAADVLDVGKNRVWFDPDRQADIADAITREDVRDLVAQGVIAATDKQGNSRGRARERAEKRAYGHQTGHGSRSGSAEARQGDADSWRSRIRAQRRRLAELRDAGEITPTQHNDLYNMAGGGEFKSVADLERFIETEVD